MRERRRRRKEDKPRRGFLPALLEIVPAWKLAPLITRPSLDFLLSWTRDFDSWNEGGLLFFFFFNADFTDDRWRFHYVSTRAFFEFGGMITSGWRCVKSFFLRSKERSIRCRKIRENSIGETRMWISKSDWRELLQILLDGRNVDILFFEREKLWSLRYFEKPVQYIVWSIFFDHFSRTLHITNLYQVICSILRKKIDRFVLNNNQRSIINKPRKYLSRDL